MNVHLMRAVRGAVAGTRSMPTATGLPDPGVSARGTVLGGATLLYDAGGGESVNCACCTKGEGGACCCCCCCPKVTLPRGPNDVELFSPPA